nr:CHAT domain-containing tetratricopeptide repeat protein [Catenibacterium mitsuokai]
MSKFTIDDLAKQEGEGEIVIDIKDKNEYQKTYEVYKSELEEKHPFTPGVLEKIIRGYSGLGNYKEACELQKVVYNVRKEILGENHLETLSALNDLASYYSYLGDYNAALKMRNTVYNARKDILGGNHSNTLSALENLAVSYSYLGDYNSAFELQNTVYNARKEIQGENHPDTLSALYCLACSYFDLGDYDKALEIQNTVCNECKKNLGENHLDILTSLANLANIYSYLKDYNKVLEMRNAVYNAKKDILGANHPDTLSALENLAVCYPYFGYYKKVLELQNTSYNARKDILGANYSDALTELDDLICSYVDLGYYKKACKLQNTVYNARKDILGENHLDTLRSLEGLACTYSYLGDYNKACELEDTSYNARKEVLGENHPDTLFILNDLAISYSRLGYYNKACELQNTSYNALKDILGAKHSDTLTVLANLASSFSDLGDYNKALELCEEVYLARKEIQGENHPDTLKSLTKLAYLYSDSGDFNKALEMNKAVYNARKEIQGANHPDTLSALNDLAISYSYFGDYNKACDLQNTVYNKRKEILGDKHPDTLRALSNLLDSQIHQDKTDNESIKNHMIAYFENINNLKTTAFRIKEISSRRNFLKSFNAVYELLKNSVFERNIKDLPDYLFINKNLSFEMDVNRFHNETMGERLSLEGVSHAIGNQLIIDFYELDNSKCGVILIKDEKYSYYAVDYSDIINGTFINDEGIQSFICSIRDYEHIYICPDGKLYNLSFERILNCLNISYLSSVQTLFKKNTDDDHIDKLVSFVYPDFSGTQSEDNDRGDTKGVLYGSYLEGMFIHDIYGEKSTIYSSYQANHDNFLNTRRPKILHVSTHGDYLNNEQMEPMDRGILCLSGYNVEENNSGYISAREIQYMDLKGTELVVLSACNTGLGENISGEGIYGIRRAFELAGCQTLLLTVEEVDDYNSAIFMKSFYERYNQTNNIYQSFKDTKEYLKEYGLVELKELRDVFEKEMKNKIKNPFVYTRNFNELNKRIEESETIGQIVRKKNNQYIQEDWNGFIIQGKIEN